jgi:hypothetical protein
MDESDNISVNSEKPASFWNRVYIAVVGVTVVVITALWAFSKYFSS